jgi:ubiquinone/menaquinone biosynthesis C-methylase UbiE
MTESANIESGLSPEIRHRNTLRNFQQAHYKSIQKSARRHRYFHRRMAHLLSRYVLPGQSVLDIGCGNGQMLAALAPSRGVGLDITPAAIEEASSGFSDLSFHQAAVEELESLGLGQFDYVILSGVLQQLYDLHTALARIQSVCHNQTRLILCTYSRLWQPIVALAEKLGLKCRVPDESWLPSDEIPNILAQTNFQVVRQTPCILCPVGIPLLSNFLNRWIAPLPGIRHLCLCTLTIARSTEAVPQQPSVESVSIVVPVCNEAGNIGPLLQRLPMMAKSQEVIFVEGNSTDNTWEIIQKTINDYPGPMKLRALQQTGRGKGDAVRTGFAAATGDIFAILDGDLSVPPEELPRFMDVIRNNKCEFANGSRLVYPMEKQAMQFLNMIANKFFGWTFTYLLGQSLRDTLCGTKVLRRSDYLRIEAQRNYFGDFDPFGDFDLLFGAARLDLKILDVPVHYKQRTYGATNISRFRHGVLLLRMCLFAARKIKFV